MNGIRKNKPVSSFMGLLGALLSSFLLLSLLLFFIFHFLPSDPVEALLEKNTHLPNRELIKEQLGLNKTFFQQLKIFSLEFFSGRFGTSFWTGQSVSHVISQRIMPTLGLAIPALFLFALIGVLWGFFQAWTAATLPGGWAFAFNSILFCIPAFSLASLLARFNGPRNASAMALLIYVLSTVPTLASLIRDHLLNEETQTYVRAAKAKGLSRLQLFSRHLLKSCLPIFLTQVPWWWSMFLGTSIIIEPLFRIPGLGLLTFEAFRNQDIPILLGVSLFLGFGRLALGALADFFVGKLQ